MTFEDIALELPNGFHDSVILKISFDSVRRVLSLLLSVDVSQPDGTDEELCRELELVATGVSLFFIEPPDPEYHSVINGEGISASGFPVVVSSVPAINILQGQLPPGSFAYRFFLNTWNSFLYLAANEATYHWL